MVRQQLAGDGEGMTDTAWRVREIVSQVTGLGTGELPDDAGLPSRTWTSLQHLSVLLAVAEQFGFDLAPDLVRDLTTVGALIQHVRSRSFPPHPDSPGDGNE
jgi:acyl carrier protein